MTTEVITAEEPFDFGLFNQARERALGRIMWKMKRFLSSYIELRLTEQGFSDFKPSYLVFLSNLEEGGITNNELAKRAGVTKQAMSKVVKLLEDEGYIYTVKNEKDSRSSRIFINERGKQLLKTVFNCMQEVRQKFEVVAGAERVGQMIDTMVMLVREMDREGSQFTLSHPECSE